MTATFDVERDATAPAVTVNVPARIYTATIPVSWTVSELGAGATGVYTVSVMTDTGPLQLWLSGVTSTSASLAGELGHRYTFVVTTTDNVSNVGQGSAETIVTQVTKYYYIGSSRVAMRQGSEVAYLHADHLGTVSLATNASQAVLARTLHLPYGGVRWSSGTMPTDYGFTGQRDDSYIKLIQMGARWYDPWVGRFVSADTLVPDLTNPQDFNHYAYAHNNPLLYNDPSGHQAECAVLGPTPFALACGVVSSVIKAIIIGVTTYVVADAIINAPPGVSQPKPDVTAIPPARPIRPPTPIVISRDGTGPSSYDYYDPLNRPTPTPQRRGPDFYPIPTPTETLEPVVRVRHYSRSIAAIRDQMFIRSGDELAIFAEYPITTPYEEGAIQRTTKSFMRPLGRIGGFVEFNVDLRKWQMEPDPNLLGIATNAVRIRPRPLALMAGFPLYEPGVDPLFYNWQGRPLE